MNATAFFILASALAIVLVRMLVSARARVAQRTAAARATELQEFLSACVEELRLNLSQNEVDRGDRIKTAEQILAKMESRNSAGALEAFIQDNREAVQTALARSDAA